jgi:acyl-CoA thioester hydrolase
MKPPAIPLVQITALPCVYRLHVPPELQDYNGHMNIRGYMTIFDDAGLPLYDEIGLTPQVLMEQGYTTFDLEHHLHYLNEVHIGDSVAVYVRLCGLSAKRMHYLMFMVNETRASLASIFECVNTFVDQKTRRTAPYLPAVAAKIQALLIQHQTLTWAAPLSGVMGA